MSDTDLYSLPCTSTVPSRLMACLLLVFLLCARGEGQAADETTAAEIDSLDYRDVYADLVTPARFHAVTLPKGFSRLRIDSEYFTGSYLTEEEDETGRIRSLDADEFYEWNSALTFTHGIASNVEVGLRVPFVYSSFDKSQADDFSELPDHASESGLGNVSVLLLTGLSWNDESDNLLSEVSLGLPTDTRENDLFTSGGTAGGRLTYEHYWDRFGVVVEGFGDYFGDDNYEGGEWSYGYRAGIEMEPADRVFCALLAGHDDQGDLSIESFVEIMVTSRSSLEIFGGTELRGDDDETFAGVGLSFLLGQ